jgi:acyl-CoA reductase LuxC
MISLSKRIEAFEMLGNILVDAGNNSSFSENNPQLATLNKAVFDARNSNGWFVEDNVRYMLYSMGVALSSNNLRKWISSYQEEIEKANNGKSIGVVMAGNIPLVGFHDFLSVIISGNFINAKLSGDDNKLLPAIAEILIGINKGFEPMIRFIDGKMENIDAIIATGSNNTSRYFEYYFGKYPNIIRKNRNSVGVITGNESDEELSKLSQDIFMYYGLGCRSVSHLFVPKDYDFTNFFDICSANKKIVENHKYFNNYEYNKAIFLVNSIQHFDTGNLLLTEDSKLSSPVSTINYEYYNDINSANQLLQKKHSEIQCIISASKNIENAIPPGKSQSPNLWDYADGVDTMKFLTEL